MAQRMKRIRLIAALVVVVGIAAALWFRHQRNRETATRLTLYGNVDIRQVQLAFNGNERIATIPVQEGDRVKAGHLRNLGIDLLAIGRITTQPVERSDQADHAS